MKNFPRVYYEWGHDTKGTYEKKSMEKDVKKLVEGYNYYTGSGVKVQRTPGDPVTNLIKSDLE